MTENDRESLIENYFNFGFDHSEILAFLGLVHGIFLSLRQLKRILQRKGLRRRGFHSDGDNVISAIEQELDGSGCSIGYRLMHQRLVTDYGLRVNRETVRQVLKALDPGGVQLRSKHRLKRREYYASGPDFLWHIDGYDKLKPYGFCVHGAIDGFSRRILWLEVSVSNNDPRIIAQYYLNYVNLRGSTARVIRADRGTENVHVALIQKYFRSNHDDSLAGEKSFLFGRSVSNQRIEAWWGYLRKCDANWWMNYFKDLRDQGLFSDSDPVEVECLKFCYMPLVRDELKRVALHWNLHRIRPSTNKETPTGRPDVLYFLPELTGTTNYSHAVNSDDVEEVLGEMSKEENPLITRAAEFEKLANLIMEDNGLENPTTPDEAFSLYSFLVQTVNSLA